MPLGQAVKNGVAANGPFVAPIILMTPSLEYLVGGLEHVFPYIGNNHPN